MKSELETDDNEMDSLNLLALLLSSADVDDSYRNTEIVIPALGVHLLWRLTSICLEA